MNIKRVLLVDDDADIRKICELSLVRVGKWDARVAASGQEALDLVANWKPDLIVLDVMMPGMDGLTALGKFRDMEDLAGVPVILMTAKVQTHEIERYLQLGAVGVISKPFNPMTLPEEITKLLAKSAT